jgi:two-component system, OmpR family, response regulator ChvI
MRIKDDYDDNSSEVKEDISLFQFDIPAEEIHFCMKKPNDNVDDDGGGNCCHYYCICLVDMVDSTKITAQIGRADKVRKYYSIFLNAMAAISKNFGAKVIKNIGDALLFYFPDTSNNNYSDSMVAFKAALECFTTIIAARDLINKKLSLEGLPEVSYRVSADYGQVEIGTAVSSGGAEDFFGSTVNICSKMNRSAERNGIVIGGDLYRILKQFPFESKEYYYYEFKEVDQLSIGLKQSYPLYSAKIRKGERNAQVDNYNLMSSIFKKSYDIPTKPNIDYSAIANIRYQTKTCKHTVMLVDDEPDVLATFETFLIEGGYSVESFDDPHKALQVFATSEFGHFDLIILDIRMPSMNGLQLYRGLKAIDPNVKIVFLTALDAAEELVSVLDGGIRSADDDDDDVITKPIYSRQFLQKIFVPRWAPQDITL